MPETILFTALERIEHIYDTSVNQDEHRIFLNLMISAAVELKAGDVPKDVKWEYFHPWSWVSNPLKVKIGAFKPDGSAELEDAVVTNECSILNRDKLIKALERRRNEFFREAKEDSSPAPLTAPSTLWWTKDDPLSTDPKASKHFKEFVINEANRPVPVSQKLNLNVCFSLLNSKFKALVARCVAAGSVESDLRFFAYIENFEVEKTAITGKRAEQAEWDNNGNKIPFILVTYDKDLGGHTFSARGNSLSFDDIALEFDAGGNRKQAYESWIPVNLDFEDWLPALRPNLTSAIEGLEVLFFIGDELGEKIPAASHDIFIKALLLMLVNRAAFTAKTFNGTRIVETRLNLLRSGVPASDHAELDLAISSIKTFESDLVLGEDVPNSQQSLDDAWTKSQKILREIFVALSLKDPLPASAISFEEKLNRFRALKDAISTPDGLSQFLKILLRVGIDSSALSPVQKDAVKAKIFSPSVERLFQTNSINTRRNELTAGVAAEIEAARLRPATADLPSTVISAGESHLVKVLSSLTDSDAAIATVVEPIIKQHVSGLGGLVPQNALLKKGDIPSKEVHPVSFDIVDLVRKNAQMPSRISGIGVLLREPGKNWKCLNNCSIWSLNYPDINPPAPSPGPAPHPVPPTRDLLIPNTVVPTKLSKNGGVLQTSICYNNQPITGKSAIAKLVNAAQQRLQASEKGADDYLSYDLALEDDGTTLQVLPMLQYGKPYEVTTFVVDKGGALPKVIAEDVNKHPGILKKTIPSNTNIPGAAIKTFDYKRHVGFSTPRIASQLPVYRSEVQYLESEVLANHLLITKNSAEVETLESIAIHSESTALTFSGLSFSIPAKLVISLVLPSGEKSSSIEIDFSASTVTIDDGTTQTTGTTANPIESIRLQKITSNASESYQLSVEVGDVNGENFAPISFSGNQAVLVSGHKLADFRVIIASLYLSGAEKGVFVVQRSTFGELESGNVVGMQTDLFQQSNREFVFLSPDREGWKRNTPKHSNSEITGVKLLPPPTSFENWDRWFCNDTRFNVAERKLVVKEYFKSMWSNSGYSENADAVFSINDPACDEVGYVELIKIFPDTDFQAAKPSAVSTFFNYLRSNSLTSEAILNIKALPILSNASISLSAAKTEVTVGIPEGELWELRVYSSVQSSEFSGANHRCDAALSSKRLVTHSTGKQYYIYSPRVIRIEAATESPLFKSKRIAFLQSLKSALSVVKKDNLLQVSIDRSGWDAADKDYHFLVSTVDLHWQSWHWDGKLLEPFPYDWENPKDGEQKILRWEAKEFANKPESEHFTTSNKIRVRDNKIDLFKKDLSSDAKADLYRFAVTVKSRYYPLNENLALSTFTLLDSETCWKRHFVKSTWADTIPAPLVKLVFPLTNRFRKTSADKSKPNPDLLVILSEPPFRVGGLAERILPEVCKAKIPTSVGVSKELLEFGPDPILYKEPPMSGGISADAVLWRNMESLGRRQFGFFKDLGTDFPRYSASALVLPCPTPEHEGKPIAKDYSWFMMKLRFRRILDKDGCDFDLSGFSPEHNGYLSEATPETWVQYLPDSSVPGTYLTSPLGIKGKQLKTSDKDEVLSPKNLDWLLRNPGGNQEVFSFCVLVTEEVFEADGITLSERYNSVFRFKSNADGELVSAEANVTTEDLLKRLPPKGFVRVLEVQTIPNTKLEELLKGKSLWDTLFIEEDRDADARITRVSQPLKFMK